MGARSTAPIRRFGDYESKVKGTSYLAGSDGFVIGFIPNANNMVELKSDGSDPPATDRFKGVTNADMDLCVPIKKNNYWKLTTACAVTFLYWIPLLP